MWVPREGQGAGRGARRQEMLDTGAHAALEDLARAKGFNATYVSRILWLTLLAPDIVEVILDGLQPAEMQLDRLLKALPLPWVEQRTVFGIATGTISEHNYESRRRWARRVLLASLTVTLWA